MVATEKCVRDSIETNPDDRANYDRIINETLRLFPLFGLSHRIVHEDISVNDKTINSGTVVCFDHLTYHKSGYLRAEEFDADRWIHCPVKTSNFIPFGVSANRPCPAQGIASISMRLLLQQLCAHYYIHTGDRHTRSMPNRAPCLLQPKSAVALTPWHKSFLLMAMGLQDQWEDVFRSIKQLVLGTYMVFEAKKLRLCENYFKQYPQYVGKKSPGKYLHEYSGNIEDIL